MDAPREVWISNPEGVERFAGFGSCVAYKTTMSPTDVRYVRADLSPSAQPSSAQERRLAEYIVAHADDPERCVCVHDRREHRNGAGPCMHGYDGHVVDCASDCRMYQPDTEYREPAIVTECRAVLASPEAPAKAWVEISACWCARDRSVGARVEIVAGGWRALVTESGDTEHIEIEAAQVAAALGLEIRR